MHCSIPSKLRLVTQPSEPVAYKASRAKTAIQHSPSPTAAALVPLVRLKLDMLRQDQLSNLRKMLGNANLLDQLQLELEKRASAMNKDLRVRLTPKIVTVIEEIPELDEDDSSDEEEDVLTPTDHDGHRDFRHGPVMMRSKTSEEWHSPTRVRSDVTR